MAAIPPLVGQIIDFFTMLSIFLIVFYLNKNLLSTINISIAVISSIVVSFIGLKANFMSDLLVPILLICFIRSKHVKLLEKLLLYLVTMIITFFAQGIPALIVLKIIGYQHLTNIINALLFIIVYVVSFYIISFCLAYLLKKYGLKLKQKFDISQPFIVRILLVTLLLLVLGFYTLAVTARVLHKLTIMYTTILAVSAVITIFAVVALVLYISSYITKMNNERLLEDAKNNALYLNELQKNYLDLRQFKHDYKNLLTTLSILIQDQKLDDATNLLNKFLESATTDTAGTGLYNADLAKITDTAVKGLLVSKMMVMQHQDIHFDMEVNNLTGDITKQKVDLLRILGILFDNAIEATNQVDQSSIRFTLLQTAHDIELTLENTINTEHTIQLNKLVKPGYSTKQGHSGLGLSTVHQLCNKDGFLVRFNTDSQLFSVTLNFPTEG